MNTNEQAPFSLSFSPKPVKVTVAGKVNSKRTPYQVMKERIECAEKLVDEMAAKEQTYRKAAKECLRQMVCLRTRLNESIRWVREHVIDKRPIVIPDVDPIVIEDDMEVIGGEEEKPDEIGLPPDGLQKSPSYICVKKEEGKNPNEDLFGSDEPETKSTEEVKPMLKKKAPVTQDAKVEELMKEIGDLFANKDMAPSNFLLEWEDDYLKVKLYYEKAHPDWGMMDRYFKESAEGWFHMKFNSFCDFITSIRIGFEVAKQNESKFLDFEFCDGEDFFPAETQV